MHVAEAGRLQVVRELIGRVAGEAVGGMAVCAGLDETFGEKDPSARGEYPAGFG